MPRFVRFEAAQRAAPAHRVLPEEFIKHHRCLQHHGPTFPKQPSQTLKPLSNAPWAARTAVHAGQRRRAGQRPAQEVRRRDRPLKLVRSRNTRTDASARPPSFTTSCRSSGLAFVPSIPACSSIVRSTAPRSRGPSGQPVKAVAPASRSAKPRAEWRLPPRGDSGPQIRDGLIITTEPGEGRFGSRRRPSGADACQRSGRPFRAATRSRGQRGRHIAGRCCPAGRRR